MIVSVSILIFGAIISDDLTATNYKLLDTTRDNNCKIVRFCRF